MEETNRDTVQIATMGRYRCLQHHWIATRSAGKILDIRGHTSKAYFKSFISANFHQKPLSSHQAFFQFFAGFEGNLCGDFMGFPRLLWLIVAP